uniref:Putative tail tubular protein n=1 Tax=viral metagenome TaxID=1070528 RepID=A0A6H1ZE24_9ZZZZ
MASNQVKSNFTAGEVSKRLAGQVDYARYANACFQMENAHALPQGGFSRRTGSYYVAGTKSNGAALLVPFEFSVIQSYVLEFGNLYMRVYKDQGQILSGGVPYEIVSPYAAADLPYLKWAQSADVLYIVHPDYPVKQVTRTGDTAWTITNVSLIDGPYLDVTYYSDFEQTLTPSGTTGSITLTASDTPFLATMVGASVRWQADDNEWYWLTITAYTSTSVVTATVKGAAGLETGDLPNINASGPYRIGAFGPHAGYPAAISIYDQRLCFGYTDIEPTRIWGSVSADLVSFAPGTADADAVVFELGSQGMNAIRWLAPGRQLLVGTAAAEWVGGSGSGSTPMTPTNVQFNQQTPHGSADIQAVPVGDATLFIQRYGRRVHEAAYSFEVDKYKAPDMTILAEHITKGGLEAFAWQPYPDSRAYFVRSDGVLCVLTYYREEEVVAWSRYVTDGVYESICVIPGASQYEVWVVVRRTVDGSTVRYVELFQPALEDGDSVEDAFFVDSGLSYSGVATSSLSGLDHLEGESVAILADGAVHPNETVVSGAITLDWEVTKAHVGLPFTTTVEPVPFEYQSTNGGTLGRIQRIVKCVLQVQNTVGGQMGADADNLFPIIARLASDNMDEAIPLQTGFFGLDIDAEYKRGATVLLVQDQPLPFTVSSLSTKLQTEGV